MAFSSPYTNNIYLEDTNISNLPKLLNKQTKLTPIRIKAFHTMLVENSFEKRLAKDEEKDLTIKGVFL